MSQKPENRDPVCMIVSRDATKLHGYDWGRYESQPLIFSIV